MLWSITELLININSMRDQSWFITIYSMIWRKPMCLWHRGGNARNSWTYTDTAAASVSSLLLIIEAMQWPIETSKPPWSCSDFASDFTKSTPQHKLANDAWNFYFPLSSINSLFIFTLNIYKQKNKTKKKQTTKKKQKEGTENIK